MVSWNARALVHYRSKANSSKRKFLQSLASRFACILLQEVHGSPADVAFFLTLFRRHTWRYYPGPDPATGGLLVGIVSTALVNASWTDLSVADGRIVRSELSHPSGRIALWNVHLHQVSGAVASDARARILSDLRESKASPLTNPVFLAGDFNLGRNGEIRSYLDPLAQAEYVNALSSYNSHYTAEERQWDAVLLQFSEFNLSHQTHFSSAGRFENRLDRIFSNFPPWIFRLLHVSRPVFPSPYHMFQNDLSDHSPVGISLAFQPRPPLSDRPVPSYVTKHPFYQTVLHSLESQLNISSTTLKNLSSTNPFQAIRYYSKVLRRAASITRNILLQTPNKFSDDSLLTSASRAYSFQNCSLARLLLDRHPRLRRHLSISSGNDSVVIRNMEHFSAAMSMARRGILSEGIAANASALSRGRANPTQARNRIKYLSE